MTKKYLTLEEASEYCRLSPKTLRSKINMGLLRATKPGRNYLVEQTDLEIFMKKAQKRVAS